MKGFFTQCYVVLTRNRVDFNELVEQLQKHYPVVKRNPSNEQWEFSGENVLIDYDSPNNGYAAIDYVEHAWPDGMGSNEQPILLGAWSTGHFGPFAYPNGLKRAHEQAWRLNENDKDNFHHSGFLRLKISYVFGAESEALVRPANYNSMKELEFLDGIMQVILGMVDDGIYFNPNGELLLTGKSFQDCIDFSKASGLPALDLYSNVRLYNIDDDFRLMDSVGNLQFDLPDMEVVIPKGKYDLGEIDRFIRNATFYLLTNGEVVKHGDTMEGPGDINWRGFLFEKGICDPPRRTIRWFPSNVNRFPASILPIEDKEPARKWWKLGK
jgi:hypothetical protein